MKSLVLYYSKTGNTKYTAETIAQEVGADLYELKRKREIKSSGFMLMFRGGFQSMTKRKSKLEDIQINFDDYDLIFLGFPIWAWNVHPAVRGLLEEYSFSGKKFALFCTCASSGTKQLEETAKILEGNVIVGQSEYKKPLKNDTEEQTKTMRSWAKQIISDSKK